MEKKEVTDKILMSTYFNTNARTEETFRVLRSEGYTFSNGDVRKRLRGALREHADTLENAPRGAKDPLESLMLEDGNYFITSAQNNTSVHKGFLQAIENFCQENKATLLVSKMTYKKKGFENLTAAADDLWYDPALAPYLMNEQIQLGDFVFYGNFDILPTAVNPLSGLESHSGEMDCAFPHTKLNMRPISTMPNARAKHIYTTGACTLLNYIERKAGQKAELHHVFGGLYVEVRNRKATVTPISARESTGGFYVYDRYYSGEEESKEAFVYAVNFGDIHLEKLDRAYETAMYAVIDDLKPANLFLHDLLDFEARNHHEDKAKFSRFSKYAVGRDSVERNVQEVLLWLIHLARKYPQIKIHVVPSNHNDALYKWANKEYIGEDFVNLRFWHAVNYLILKNIDKADGSHNRELLEQIAEFLGRKMPENVVFHTREESVRFKEIEFNLHGDMGANGARGTPQGMSRLGFKANTGHSHSAGIYNGIYVAGVSGSLAHGYNKGLSSWSNSFVVTYMNGKRSIITRYPSLKGEV